MTEPDKTNEDVVLWRSFNPAMADHRRVLVVDDYRDAAEALQLLLDADGFECRATADSGKSDCPGQSNEPMHAFGQLRWRIAGRIDQSIFHERGDRIAIGDERGDETRAGFVQDACQIVRQR